MQNIDVLNLEWTSFPSRDRETATLLCNYLRHMGLIVVEGSVHNGFVLLGRYQPRLFFITNTVGAFVNCQVMKYAKSLGIWCVSGVSEGIFREDEIGQFVWGSNSDQYLFEDLLLLWTEGTKKMVKEAYPELIGKIKISGSLGCDRYKIIQQDNSLFERNRKKTTKLVVGVGCWNFGFVDPKDTSHEYFRDILTEGELGFFRNDRELFNRQLLDLIESNLEVTFLLKEHPSIPLGYWASGIEGCERFENVLIVKNEATIFECLSASDIWLSYESTTALEGWLMGKQTGLLNPSGVEFPMRHHLHRGQPNFSTADAWTEAITIFEKTGKLPGFERLKKKREDIIKDVIQWDDGLNHVRAGNVILELLDSGRKPSVFPIDRPIKKPTWKYRIRQSLLWHLSPYLTGISTFNAFNERYRKSWNNKEIRELSAMRMRQQLEYYQSKGLTKNDLRLIKAL